MRNINRYDFFKIGYVFVPFLSFLFTLKYYKSSWFKNALWLFIIFFGFSMSFTESIDSYAYKTMFEDFVRGPTNVNSFVDVFDPSTTGRIDFATSFINYVLGGFTENYHFLFGMYALIFGYFYSRNIDYLLKLIKTKHAELTIGLIVFLAFYIGFWNINGFRFWTASQIFIFGIIHFIIKRNKTKGLLFMGLSLTIHLSFLFPILIFLLYNYIPKLNKIFIIIIFILAFYNPLSNLGAVADVLDDYAYNEQIGRKVEVYTSEEAVEKMSETSIKTNIFKITADVIIRGFILVLAWILVGKFDKLKKHEINFFNFGLILALAGSVMSFIPSLGSRFTIVGLFSLLFAIIMILLNHDFYKNKRRFISTIGYFSCGLVLIINIWILSVFSIHTVLGNYFTVFLDNSDVFYSIGDLLIEVLK